VVTYIFNTSGASDRVPVIEFGDFTAVNNSDEPITNFIVNDEEKKRKRTSIKRDNFSKKECKKQGYKPPLPGSVIDLTQLENENLNSPIVKEVAKTLLKICKRDAQKTTGYLMINLLDTSMKIIHDYSNIVIDDPVSAAVDDSRALNNRKDVECEEYEWVDEIVDFGNSADGAVEGGLFPMGTGDKENSARGAVDEFARSTGDLEDDSTGASGAVDAGPVSRTGDLEDDSTGAGGAVDGGPVSRTGDLEDDSTGASGAVDAGPVSRTGDLEDDSTGASGAVDGGPVSRTGDLADDSTGAGGAVHAGPVLRTGDLADDSTGASGAVHAGPVSRTGDLADDSTGASGAVDAGPVSRTGDLADDWTGASGAVDGGPVSRTGDLEDDSTGASGAVDGGPVSRTGDLEDDSTGASGAVDGGPVSRTGDLEDDPTGASGAVDAGPVSRTGDLVDDSTGASGAVDAGPVSRTGDLADDSTGAGGAVHAGPVSRTGDLADDSTGSVVDSGQSIDASDLVYAAAGAVGAIQTKGILQDLIMPKNIATDFYLKPVSWCTIRFCDESIRLPNPTNFFCCVNVVVQIVFRISILKDLILGIDDRITGGGVCERDLNFIKQLATLYNKATISGKSVGYYDDVVRTCYMASFYSLDQFKLAATARNRHKSLCTPLVQHCPHELLTLLLGILSNVYKYSSIDHAIPSVLSYNDISEEEINLHGLNAYVLKNTLAKQYFNANNTISPSSEIFKIIVMTTYVCRNCGVSTCSYDVHHELDLHPPSYDFEKGITKLTLAELLDSEFSVKEVRMPCRCTSHLHNGEGVQHDMKYSILRCPIILVSYNYDNYHFS